MSTGKSTIAELVNYCLGGGLVRTPAVSSEIVSVQLKGTIGETQVLLERSLEATNSVEASWESASEFGRETFPIQAAQSPILGENVFNFSDLFAMALHKKQFSELTKVQRRGLIVKYEHDVSDHMPIWIRLPRPAA